MNHQEYVRCLRASETISDAYQVVSRGYPNICGAQELIFLPQKYWDYADWLEEGGNINFAEWVLHCDKHPHEGMVISHLLMYWLWLDECNRWIYDDPRPTDSVPKRLNRHFPSSLVLC